MIHLDHVTKRFGDHLAVDDVSLDIPTGAFVALVGASGSGKSTLLRTINRLIAPDAGRIAIGRIDADAPAWAQRRAIGYVFQDIGLFPHMTVAENVAIGLRIAGAAPAARRARADELLALVGLGALGDRLPAELSGGQRQRVGAARALATEPRVMLLDEPFGALDPVTRDALAATYRDLHDRLGLTSLLVTHDMAEALLLADRVLVMADGRIVADAAPADLLAGRAGSEAEALVAVPRRQAERLAGLKP